MTVLASAKEIATAQVSSISIKDKAGFLQNSYPLPSSFFFQKQNKQVQQFLAGNPSAHRPELNLKTVSWNFTVGSTKSWYADNIITESRYLVPSTCRAVGTHCYVFVENASWNSKVDQTVVDSIRIYFDQKTLANPLKGIFEMTVNAFGDPPDVDADSKIIILLLDIKDGYSGSGGFAAGYFYAFNEISPSYPGFATSNNAEIYFLDTNPLDLKKQWGMEIGLSTTAHEFQHMINFRYDIFFNRLTFINEGCSLIAEVNCGYPVYDQSEYINEPNHYLFDWRQNDLNTVIHDYARAARFFVYLRDQASMAVFKPMVASLNPDERGINDGLAAVNSTLRFDKLLKNWFVANILDDRNVDSSYGYIYPNLPKPQTQIYLQPSVPIMDIDVQNYGVQYLSFKMDSLPRISFTSTSSSFVVKAIEIGPTSKRVLDVAPYIDFTEPLMGTVYKEVHFAIINTDSLLPLTCKIRSSSNKYELNQNFPNPFNHSTTIYYALPKQTHVSIKVFNIRGQVVASVLDGIVDAGHQFATFTPKNLASGAYFYQLKTGDFTETKKMLILK
jgi:hypothetical protein